MKGKSYIVYSNGSVGSTRTFLFFRSYPSVKPGAEIYVPVREEREKLSPATAIALTTGLASLAAIMVSLFK
ncbi:hypothetical protein D3C72_1259130 [compost metagenome]